MRRRSSFAVRAGLAVMGLPSDTKHTKLRQTLS
jgi:hypothetical protein